jgi:hypothetical protein
MDELPEYNVKFVTNFEVHISILYKKDEVKSNVYN